MEFLDGKSLNDVRKEAGDRAAWQRRAFGQQLLGLVSQSWGRMIFGSGLFHGDPHPGASATLQIPSRRHASRSRSRSRSRSLTALRRVCPLAPVSPVAPQGTC